MKRLNYVKSIRNTILILTTLLLIVSITFGVSYSNFIYKSSNHRAVEMFVNKLQYSIKINGIESNTFTIAPGNSVLNIELLSLNKIDTYFKLLYLNNPSLNIYCIDTSVSGLLDKNETKKYKLFVNNSSNENISGNLYVSGGYVNNGLGKVEILNDYSEINNFISIGEVINYIPNGIANLTKYSISNEHSGYNNQSIYLQSSKWKILNINDDGTIEIISSKPINIDNLDNKFCLSGYLGYNNGVYLLNDLSNSLYGTSKYALIARNTDLNDLTKYLNSNIEYPFISKKYNDIYYPNIYTNQSDNEELHTNKPTIGNISLENNYYSRKLLNEDFKNSVYYEIFMNSGSYWLSSRYTNLTLDNATWGLLNVSDKSISGSDLYNSKNSESTCANSIRPIIRLTANIKLIKDNSVWNILEN